MSISVIQQPFRYNLSKNKQIFTFSGSNYTLDGFEYIVDIYEQTGTTLLSRNSVPLYPDTPFGIFNVSNIVADYIPNNDLVEFAIDGTPVAAPNSYFNYRIELGEKFLNWVYDDYFFAPSGHTIFSGTTQHSFSIGDEIIINHDSSIYFPQYSGKFIVEDVPDQYSILINTPFDSGPVFGGTVKYSDNRYIINSGVTSVSAFTAYIGAMNEDDYINYTPEDYVYGYSAGTKSLSSTVPDEFLMNFAQRFYLYNPNLFGTSARAAGYTVRTRNDRGDILGVYRVVFTGATVTDCNYIGVGPMDLIDIQSYPQYVTVLSGQATIMTSDVYEYEIIMLTATYASLTTIRTFRTRNYCTEYGNFIIMFQDRLGSYGSFNFNYRRQEELGIKRTFYNKSTGIFDPSTGTYSDRVNDFGLKSLDINANKEMTIRIEIDNEDDSQYFKELLLSKNTYYLYNNELIPIIIKDGTYEILDDTAEVISYELKIAVSKSLNSL